MKSLPKLLLVVCLGTLLFSLSTKSVLADCPAGMSDDDCKAITNLFTNNQKPGPWYNQNPSQFADKVFGGSQDEIFGERYTYAQINWIVNSIASMLNPAQGVTNPNLFFQFIQTVQGILKPSASGPPTMADYAKLGPVGLFAGATSTMYSNPPASGIQEVKATAQKLFDAGTGAAPVYAQGYGFNGLNSGGAVHALWTATRNMSYLIMVILLIASGFLIMFRVKINPQTVVSLQTMIPKLIITMLLVTFSFAIAGLVIDLVYISLALVVGMLASGGLVANAGTMLQQITSGGFSSYVIPQIFTSLVLSIAIEAVLLLLGFVPGLQLAPVLGVIIIIVILLFWLITLFRIFWMLLKAYVMLILRICIGPLQIMLDLIPGQKGFGPWMRNLIADASVFVVVPVMFIIQHILSWDPFVNNILGLKALGPLVTGGIGGTELNLPYFHSVLTGGDFVTRWGIGFVIFAITPKMADIIRDMLKIPPFKYGNAIGEAFAAGTLIPRGIIGAQTASLTEARKAAEAEAVRTGVPTPMSTQIGYAAGEQVFGSLGKFLSGK